MESHTMKTKKENTINPVTLHGSLPHEEARKEGEEDQEAPQNSSHYELTDSEISVKILRQIKDSLKDGTIPVEETEGFGKQLLRIAREENEQLIKLYKASFDRVEGNKFEDFDKEFFLDESRSILKDLEDDKE